ncbi:MAG: hypothetical protein SFY32_17065 [Bacteroidota bacterium]|nr:hypothetical protein [Bacteroidota bacterium]
MKTTVYVSMIAIVMLSSCAGNKQVSQTPAIDPPTEKAQAYNYNYNQAKKIVNYTSKHKKLRQKIANHNRDIQNDNWYRLNASKKNPDLRNQGGQFKFYKNN